MGLKIIVLPRYLTQSNSTSSDILVAGAFKKLNSNDVQVNSLFNRNLNSGVVVSAGIKFYL